MSLNEGNFDASPSVTIMQSVCIQGCLIEHPLHYTTRISRFKSRQQKITELRDTKDPSVKLGFFWVTLPRLWRERGYGGGCLSPQRVWSRAEAQEYRKQRRATWIDNHGACRHWNTTNTAVFTIFLWVRGSFLPFQIEKNFDLFVKRKVWCNQAGVRRRTMPKWCGRASWEWRKGPTGHDPGSDKSCPSLFQQNRAKWDWNLLCSNIIAWMDLFCGHFFGKCLLKK